MNLLPYNKLEIIVDAPLPNVQELIAANVGPKGLKKGFPSLFGDKKNVKYESELQRIESVELHKEYMFEGEVFDTGFTIERKIEYRNSVLPIMYGTLEPHPYGTKISVEMKLHPFIICFLMVAFIIIVSGFAENLSILKAVETIAIALILTHSCFWFEVWRSKSKFMDIFRDLRIVKQEM